ncbi:MAG: hypothetical protein GWM90_16725 [Gemmatimonadetes bacterium]|nr:hypothetical protein [Gemmatimonadota bacterium]NIQ55933.1 hypothetical protein [Gemmatimonadota bacterium]NIU76131.1 hypothetical protein [Gammaproteobacteria bacterium]NIX45679.1 hypothetical protein [Gemmatimonadota bacterium]NIY09982.1 hypothetical protein [Gemmatimonadota bacterium]
MTSPEDLDAERKRIVRKLGLLTWGLIAAAVLLAVAGGALLAWIFTGAGYPFLRTWLIVTLLLLAIPAAVHLAPWPRKKDGDG